MKIWWRHAILLIIGFILMSHHAQAQYDDGNPVIPMGLDAYRMWDRWPEQRIGARAYMRSTYDRSGGNESADASHFLYMGEGEGDNVTLDILGKGVLYFVRTNHWHGSPWHYKVDGKDYVVKETGTAHPNQAKKLQTTTFIPYKAFPKPLAYTWGKTKGADLMWVPIGFKDSLKLAYARTHYGTGYYIYKKYANEDNLSQPVDSWNIKQTPATDVLKLIGKAGTDIAPKNIQKETGSFKLNKEKVLLANIKSAPSVVRSFKITLPLNMATKLEKLRLQIIWDGASYPSVNAPLSLFFGAGTLYNRSHKKYLVKGFPINIRFDYTHKKVHLACYYPMPFFKSARFQLTGINPADTKIKYEIRYEPYHVPANFSSYFHATYHNFPNPKLGKDLVLLDTRGEEGHAQWSGSFVGTSIIFSHDAFLPTLEGDPRFFFDGSKTPQAYGTGTEEWCGGGDYWGGKNMTLPFAGHPTGAPSKKEAKNKKDLIESGYRFLLADAMPFGNRAEIHLEHGGWNLSREHYETVTYWYGLPAPSLVKTDEIDVGKKKSEQTHHYKSPQASNVQQVVSRYEWGIDTFPPTPPWGMKEDQKDYYKRYAGSEVYPALQKDGRYTRGTTTFTVALDSANRGVLLRRTLDYSFPNQNAEVYVSNADKGTDFNWKKVGRWYLAGSNTDVYSNPKNELGDREYHEQTSDRRFRDDEFLIPARFTKGNSSMKVRIEFKAVNRELYPGKPFSKKSAWSALKYEVLSFKKPDFSFLNNINGISK